MRVNGSCQPEVWQPPGRAFFSVQVIEKDESTARLHSHSAVDEYYLILDGKGTLRCNGKEIEVKRGDIIGKPTGPDIATHLIADRGERLCVLDMEVWPERLQGFFKDLMSDPDFNEIIMGGPGWDTVIPLEALMPSEDAGNHYNEGYRRTKDGGWVPAKLRGHKKIRKDTDGACVEQSTPREPRLTAFGGNFSGTIFSSKVACLYPLGITLSASGRGRVQRNGGAN